MISKIHRFHGLGSLNYAYRRGMSIRGQYFGIKTVKNKQNSYRVAVVVSKKVAKSAPKRNRIRRRVYEAIRLTAPKYLTNQDVIINIYDDKFLELPFTEIVRSVELQLNEVARLN